MNCKPVIVCLTPVKNEAWILGRFISATSLWADYIIIADQNSTDGSQDIAKKYPKVILINNPQEEYNEVDRQRLLLAEARKIKGRKLLITLDADEVFTSGFQRTKEWTDMLNAEVGQVFGFQWINLMPGFEKAWIPSGHFPWAMIDNGSEHHGSLIHSPRLPVEDWDKVIKLTHIKVIHFQYINWSRMNSKHNFYQCLERLKYPHKASVDIYRMYHHMYNIDKSQVLLFKDSWVEEYDQKGIKFNTPAVSVRNWFDDEVELLLEKFGGNTFRKVSIWDTKWRVKDPRSFLDKLIHIYLFRSQRFVDNKLIVKIDRFLRFYYK
jgi:Glycosyl transferase family 2.